MESFARSRYSLNSIQPRMRTRRFGMEALSRSCCNLPVMYRDELAAANRQGAEAHDAMERWVSRDLDSPDVPGAVLEGYARDLRQSRERIRKLLSEHGNRDDIMAALGSNEEYHRSLGLSIRDLVGEPAEDE